MALSAVLACSASTIAPALAQAPSRQPVVLGQCSEQAAQVNGPDTTDVNAQAGNGRITVGLDSAGNITVFKYPNPSYYNQVKYFTTYTFLFWHELAGRLLGVSLSPDQTAADPLGRIGAVASESQGAVRVLLYDYAPYDPTGGYGTTDPNPYDHQVTVDLQGLGAGAHRYSLQLLDGGSPYGAPVATSGTTAGSVTVDMYGESVSLLTVDR